MGQDRTSPDTVLIWTDSPCICWHTGTPPPACTHLTVDTDTTHCTTQARDANIWLHLRLGSSLVQIHIWDDHLWCRIIYEMIISDAELYLRWSSLMKNFIWDDYLWCRICTIDVEVIISDSECLFIFERWGNHI